MRRLHLALSIFVFAPALLSSVAAFPAAANPPRPATAGAVSDPASRIETDPKTGAVLFIVNGKEQARIDANGLHVRESIAQSNGSLISGDTTYPDDPPDPKRKTKP
jgi:hypothetical protein